MLGKMVRLEKPAGFLGASTPQLYYWRIPTTPGILRLPTHDSPTSPAGNNAAFAGPYFVALTCKCPSNIKGEFQRILTYVIEKTAQKFLDKTLTHHRT